MDLVHKLPSNRKFVVVTDQYYGAIHTAKCIRKLGHHVLMTIQKNRPKNLIKDFLHKKLKRKGNKAFAVSEEDDSLCILSYFDTGKCNFITSFGSTEVVGSTSKPDIVVQYNNNYHGVDKADAAMNLYLFSHRHRKHTTAKFFGFLYIAEVAAFRCTHYFYHHKYYTKTPFEQRDYLVPLALQLLGDVPIFRTLKEKRNPHVPWHVTKRRECAICRKNGRRTKTKMLCIGCDTFLCDQCWQAQHNGAVMFKYSKSDLCISAG